MNILGIDPGLSRTGWGVVACRSGRLAFMACGVCLSGEGALGERLARLHRQLAAVVARHRPGQAAIESAFVAQDAKAALKLGQARAVAMLAPALQNLTVAEYAPNTIKKSLSGAGHADKGQIAYMVRLLLPRANFHLPDEADALAVAICHAHHLGLSATHDSCVTRTP